MSYGLGFVLVYWGFFIVSALVLMGASTYEKTHRKQKGMETKKAA